MSMLVVVMRKWGDERMLRQTWLAHVAKRRNELRMHVKATC